MKELLTNLWDERLEKRLITFVCIAGFIILLSAHFDQFQVL
jgi:hypothetical protein